MTTPHQLEQTEAVGEAEDLGRVCGHLEAMRRGTDVLGAE